jgi:hypothetical protein
MKFFKPNTGPPIRDCRLLDAACAEGLEAHRAYTRHLNTIAPRLPPETRQFALERWYRDPGSHDCPHDAWLKEVVMTAGTDKDRKVGMRMTLLGAYHDRLFTIEYRNVVKLEMSIPETAPGRCADNVGDWLVDEFDVLPSGVVSHGILWLTGAPWRICAENVRFLSEPWSPSKGEDGKGTDPHA